MRDDAATDVDREIVGRIASASLRHKEKVLGLALVFGVLIVLLVLGGSLVIMANLNENMMPHLELMNLQMQH
jgi:hypothetical protein